MEKLQETPEHKCDKCNKMTAIWWYIPATHSPGGGTINFYLCADCMVTIIDWVTGRCEISNPVSLENFGNKE